MQAFARVKWCFRRSAALVSLRDDPKFGDSVVFRSGASLRDAIPSALRLPRPLCGLAMTQNWDGFIWKTGVFLLCSHFCAVLPRTVFKRFVLKTVSLGKPPGGCSCPESAAGRNKSAVRRKNTQQGKRKKPADILDFLNSFSILYALFFSKYHRQIRQENRNLFVYFAD